MQVMCYQHKNSVKNTSKYWLSPSSTQY